ncbi:unnamed protein product [Effrenium voratum]|uniref:RRM domain-containing protein n=1 Tax=Effrenium voratum TaxID=2562239 RepID=A0AA36J9R0_9DINO|nr:unnamed protein product [Effrenium voratum]
MAEPGSSDPSSDPSWGKVVLDGCCLYVAGVPKDAEWQELKDHMRQAGEVEYCELLYSDWGQPRGIGFVRFKTEEDAQNAIATMNGTCMGGGKCLKVEPWTGRKPSANSPGKIMYQMWTVYNKKKQRNLDPEKAQLVERIKSFQRAATTQKETWYSFCGDVKDPARHEKAKLQEFVAMCNMP